jgi:hypothetical protein
MEIKINDESASILAFPFNWELLEESSRPVPTPKQKLQILAARFREKIKRSQSERFIQSEGTFDEVEKNIYTRAALEDFAAELGLKTWPQIDRLLDRLDLLESDAREEGECLNQSSIIEFLQFLSAHSWARYPQLTVTPRGTIRAEWKAGRNKHFASEFFGNGQCGYVLFVNDQADPDMIARFSGIVSVKSLLNSIINHDVLTWTLDGE